MLAILLHPSAASILAAAERGAALLGGIVLQFPFYAGMYGVIQGTGLAHILGNAIAGVATPTTLPLWLYWYSGLVNYFVPSGGSKWAIEAPYLVEAANRLGVPMPHVVLAYAWGDMATDIIQPFWACRCSRLRGSTSATSWATRASCSWLTSPSSRSASGCCHACDGWVVD